MNANLAVPNSDTVEAFATCLIGLRSRYEALAACAVTLERKASVARLGVKLQELTAATRACHIAERDAATLPALALWLRSQITRIEARRQTESPGLCLVVSSALERAVA